MPRMIRRDERGQVMVIFAILLPMFLGLGGLVIAGGSWFTHAKHLQTKADAGALAGGGSWAFPCETDVDTRIEATARLYAGSQNPQVGNVADSEITAVINGPEFYDDDSNQNPVQNLTGICAGMRLDVKLTEDNSFPLFSLLPLFPDVKRKAVLEIQEGEEFRGEGLLPIGVRAPVPLTAAVFYNETSGQIHDVKYFVRDDAIGGIPAGLQGWTTNNTEDPSAWATVIPGDRTGVAVAVSFRDACNTNLPNPNTKIPISSAPCFEDEFGTIGELCNQGSVPIVDCHFATGDYPNQVAQAGLHFIRGYQNLDPGTGPPALETAYLENVSCIANGYFNWQRTPSGGGDCEARLNVSVDVGTLVGDYGPPGPAGNEPLEPGDVQVRFRLVRSGGGNPQDQCNYGAQCDLIGSGSAPNNLSFSTQGTASSPHLLLKNNSQQNAVAIEIKVRNAVNSPNPNCTGTGFSDNCRWFYLGTGIASTSVPPTDADILAHPVQRSFRGNTTNSGSVQWLRLTTDENCDGNAEAQDTTAASVPIGGNRCFYMDMGLKGGLAQDADEQPILFDDGTGASQTGTIDCDPNVPQGQALRDSIEFGCGPWYARHLFNTSPLCPQQNAIFDQPNPGPPWTDWPPLTCVKTRPTSTPSQIKEGLMRRLFGGSNSCPSDAAGFVKGRNYWDVTNNPLNAANPDPDERYGYKDDGQPNPPGKPTRATYFHPADPRVVTIYLVPTRAFSGSGQDTYPIAGFIQVYVTGFGQLQNGGGFQGGGPDDPCPGSTPPPLSERNCQGTDCGYIIYGHFINWVVPGGGAKPVPDGTLCNPGASVQPCVPVLVE